jgi:hypothetical protein
VIRRLKTDSGTNKDIFMLTNLTRVETVLLILMMGIVSGCSTAPTGEVDTSATQADKIGADTARASVSRDPNALNCKVIKPTGSRIGKRICKSTSEWDAIREADQALVEASRPVAVPAPTGQ